MRKTAISVMWLMFAPLGTPVGSPTAANRTAAGFIPLVLRVDHALTPTTCEGSRVSRFGSPGPRTRCTSIAAAIISCVTLERGPWQACRPVSKPHAAQYIRAFGREAVDVEV